MEKKFSFIARRGRRCLGMLEEVAVDSRPWSETRGRRVMNSRRIPLKTYCVEKLIHVKSVEAQMHPVGVVW
ncbi:hypothetical protein TNCV_2305041 [Trichonephila clavipes]|nr:hypothetical protein TNCV_2305041 [Trichonephila clavipes]